MRLNKYKEQYRELIFWISELHNATIELERSITYKNIRKSRKALTRIKQVAMPMREELGDVLNTLIDEKKIIKGKDNDNNN